MLELDKNKLGRVSVELLRLAETEKVYWPWLSDAGGKPVDKKGANKFIFGCIIDYQMNADIVWNNAKRFTEEYLKDPEELWKEIFKRYPTLESWNAKKREFNLHRFPQAHERIWKIGKIILEYYDGDVRKAWIDKKPGEILECFKNKLKLGEQLSRMALGGLISSKQISAKGDVKADLHVRRVLGRIFYDNYKKESLSEEEATELTRKIHSENPWTLDGPLYLIGGDFCKAKEPDCDNCSVTLLCDYFIMPERKETTSVFWDRKGWALYKQGEYDEAIKCYDKALQIDHNYIPAWNNKGLALCEQGEYDEAIKYYDEALKIEPDFATILSNKGLALYKQGEYGEAIKYYDEALRIEPDYTIALLNIAESLFSQGEYEKALEYCDKFLKQSPEDTVALVSKGNILFAMENYKEAIKYYDKVLEVDSEYIDVLFSKGKSLYGLEKYEEAIKCYDKVIEQDSDFILAWIGKGDSLCSLEDYKKSVKCYDKALELDSENIDILVARGNVLFKMKEYKAAIDFYEKALKLAPAREDIKEAIKECKQAGKI